MIRRLVSRELVDFRELQRRTERCDLAVVVAGIDQLRSRELEDVMVAYVGKRLFERRINKGGIVGGFIESTAFAMENTFIDKNAIVAGRASIRANARIMGNAYIFGSAVVDGNSMILGNAMVFGQAKVSGGWVGGDAMVYERARVLEYSFVDGNARISGDVVVLGSNTKWAEITDFAVASGSARILGRLYDHSQAYGSATVYSDSELREYSKAYGKASLSGAVLRDHVAAYGDTFIRVAPPFSIQGNLKLRGKAKVMYPIPLPLSGVIY